MGGGALPSPVTVFVLVSPFAGAKAALAFDPWLLGAIGTGALLVGLLAWWVANRVLRPVEALRSELAQITTNDLSRRVPVPRSRDEVYRWAVATNETLDRLEASVNQQKSFVADAAHELRSPLASLLNTLEVASAHPDRADLPAAVESALAAARRVQHLTDDLLLLARLDRPVPSQARPVDLAALASEQVAERHFADHGPRFKLSTEADMSTVDYQVRGDEGQLGRLLRNLLDNAALYATSSVRVSLAPRVTGFIDLEVLDDGPGIPAPDRERVFDRFTRLDPARERHHGGAGLGLAIARDIAVRHGGRIEVGDAPTGARMIVRLPTNPTPERSGVPGGR